LGPVRGLDTRDIEKLTEPIQTDESLEWRTVYQTNLDERLELGMVYMNGSPE